MTDAAGAGDIVRAVAAAVALLEGEAGVRDVLGVVATRGPVGIRRISRASDLPVPIVAAVCAELRKRGVVAHERPVRLTALGRELYADHPGNPETYACPSCEGRGVVASTDLEGVVAHLERAAGGAPRPRMELDQSHCTAATKLRRALFLHQAGALVGRRILVLGDDDLTSVAIGYVARQLGIDSAIEELCVVDVDSDVLGYCRSQLTSTPFATTFVEHDLRTPMPASLRERFDTVFTDPPYTPEGAELFLSRAATALAPRARANVFLCFGMKPPGELLRVQRAMVTMGFVVKQLIRNFNDYIGSGALAGTSNLYHLTSTSHLGPLVEGRHRGRLYTGDRRRVRRYRCKNCGVVQVVGPDMEWATIGDLKAYGCPGCRWSTFTPLPRTEVASRDSMKVKAKSR